MHKRVRMLLALLLLTAWSAVAFAGPGEILQQFQGRIASHTPLDLAARNRLAEVDGLGYKAANLVNLSALCNDFNRIIFEEHHGKTPQSMGWDTGAYHLLVPNFVILPSGVIKQFLQEHGVNIAARWRNLIHHFFADEQLDKLERMRRWKDLIEWKYPGVRVDTENLNAERYFPMPSGFSSVVDPAKIKAVLEQQRLPEAFLEELSEQFEGAIKEVFEQLAVALASPSKSDLSVFSQFSSQVQRNLTKLIADANSNDKRLMVRSTGREDTDFLANAGGNETKANIETDAKSILQAINEVLVSYFSKKSFMQRIGAGDVGLLQEPLLSVFIQVMIGEKVGGEIDGQLYPRCGVMFTEETEGSLARVQRASHVKTSGITIIQASYGHNEGVVSSVVPADTYYIDKLGFLYSIIRSKVFRLIPDQLSGVLVRSQPISSDIAHSAALDFDALVTLKLWAIFLEQCYQKPMDVEFIVEPNLRRISIVQARPLVHSKSQARPSYIKNPAEIQWLPVKVIGSAGGQLRLITAKDSCVMQRDIREALVAYQHEATNRRNVECVIIGEDAHVTSHEVTTFRGESKPVIFVENYQTVEGWLSSARKVIVDVQHGFIAPWDGPENTVDEIIEQGRALEGWIRYPIPLHMSLASVASLKKRFPVEAAYGPLLQRRLMQLQTRLVGIDFDFRQLYEDINDLSVRQHETNLLLKLNILNAVSNIIEVHHAMYPNFDVVNLKDLPVERKLRLLFHIHFLQALCKQAYSSDVTRGYSLELRRKELGAQERSHRTLGETEEPRSDAALALHEQREQYAKLAASSLSDDLTRDWIEFVQQLRVLEDPVQQRLHNAFIHLDSLGMFEQWLHTSFAVHRKFPDKADRILIECTHEQTQILFKQLEEKKKKLEQIQLEGVVNPDRFSKVWQDFNMHALDYFINPGEFIRDFSHSNSLGKLTALGVMSMLVERFDAAIKDMRSSKNYKVVSAPTEGAVTDRIKNDRDQIFTFKVMLKKYLELLQAWYRLLEQEGLHVVNYGELSGGGEERVDDVLFSKIPEQLDALETTDGKLLQASKTFNVSGAVLGSGATWERSSPETFEDVFTFIHQSLLVVIKKLNQKYGVKIQDDFIPQCIKELDRRLVALVFKFDILGTQSSPELSGVVFGNKKITFSYNWPQRSHSASIKLTYDRNLPDAQRAKVSITASIFGWDHNIRWQRINDILRMWDVDHKLLEKISSSEKGISVMWEKELNVQSLQAQDVSDFDYIVKSVQDMVTVARDIDGSEALPVSVEEMFFVDAGVVKPELIQRVLDFYAHHERIGLLLFKALDFLDGDALRGFVWPASVVDNAVLLLERLVDGRGNYAINTEIFFHYLRLQKRDDVFLTLKNYSTTPDITKQDRLRNKIMRLMAAGLVLEFVAQVKGALTPEQRDRLIHAFLTMIEAFSTPKSVFEPGVDRAFCIQLLPRLADGLQASAQVSLLEGKIRQLGGTLIPDNGQTTVRLFIDIFRQNPFQKEAPVKAFRFGKNYLLNFIKARRFVARNIVGNTALHVLAENNQSDIMGSVFERLTRQFPESMPTASKIELINPANNRGVTPLHVAAQRGNAEVVECISVAIERLAQTDPSVDISSILSAQARDGSTPLSLARTGGYSKVIQFLQERIVLPYVGEPSIGSREEEDEEDDEAPAVIMVGPSKRGFAS